MRKPRQILCVFVFIQNTSIYKIKVKQMIFDIRFPDYSTSLMNKASQSGHTILVSFLLKSQRYGILKHFTH